MKRTLCASLFLLWLLAACGPTTTPAAAPATSASVAAPAATATPLPPTITPLPPTAVPPSPTAVPPSPTAVPPSPTPLPPSPTPLPPTATPLRSTPTAPAPSPTPVPPTPVAITKNEFVVNVKNFEFMPRDIKVTAGTTVTWVVLQGKHTTTSDDFRTPGPNSWHSGDLATGQKFSFTFNTPGTYRFFCGFHSEAGAPLTPDNMNGTVTVQ